MVNSIYNNLITTNIISYRYLTKIKYSYTMYTLLLETSTVSYMIDLYTNNNNYYITIYENGYYRKDEYELSKIINKLIIDKEYLILKLLLDYIEK